MAVGASNITWAVDVMGVADGTPEAEKVAEKVTVSFTGSLTEKAAVPSDPVSPTRSRELTGLTLRWCAARRSGRPSHRTRGWFRQGRAG